MPDLWRTSLVKDSISLAEHATLAWNPQPRLQRPATETQDNHHLWTWKWDSRAPLNLDMNKNGATEPSWVKIRSSTGPRETSVPAVPEQLLLLRVPLSTAPCCTDMRNVSDAQSSSRTALAVSVVHLLTEIMSWPRQSLTLHTCRYCTRRPSRPIYVPFMFLHLVFQVIPNIELLWSCRAQLFAGWWVGVLVIGVFSAAAVGPAELFRITMSPPHCVRFFATSALESTSSTRDHCRWQILKARCVQTDRRTASWAQKKCQDAAPCPLVAILSHFMLWEVWRHLPCLHCLPGPLCQYETQPPSWTAIFGGVDNWISLKKQPTYLCNSQNCCKAMAMLQGFESSFSIVGASVG